MKLTKNQKIAGGVALAAVAGFAFMKLKKGGANQLPQSTDPRMQDPEVQASYQVMKNAYANNSSIKFINRSGKDVLIPNFKTWIDRWISTNDAKNQTNPPVTDVESAIVNRAIWQGTGSINRIVTVSGLGSVTANLLT